MRMADEIDDPSRPFRQQKPGRKLRSKSTAKRAVNLSIDAEILAAAKAEGLNLSQTLEDALRRLTEDSRAKKWAEQHREFIESYNALVERAGVFGEEFQDWDDPPV